MLEIFGASTPMKVIELFCKNPRKEFYSKEVGEELELSKATTIKWLKHLTKEDILIESSRGRKKIYRLRWGNPIVRQVRVLITLTNLIPVVRSLSDLRAAYLIGNSAKGTDPPDSPIELLILTRGKIGRIRKNLDDVSSKIGRPINARIMTPLEYAELSKKEPKLHERLEREKLRLVLP